MELFQLVDSRDGAESFLELAFIYNTMPQVLSAVGARIANALGICDRLQFHCGMVVEIRTPLS